MFRIRRSTLFLALGALLFAINGCTEPPPTSDPEPDTTAPPAQTAEQISEQERLKEEAEKAEREKERRIERNRTAVDNLMFVGMTVEEANEALGVRGVKGASIGGGDKQQTSYEWKLEGGITITAIFVNGKLTEKEMTE